MIFSLAQFGSFFGLILIPIGLIWLFDRKKEGNKKKFPILFWTIPLLTFVMSTWGSILARDFSRTIAINNADTLIKVIEKYREIKNQYPNDISDLKPNFIKSIPKPWIMGISGYYYEKKDDTFNLTFSQNVIMGFNFEVVVYDPTENQIVKGESTILYETDNKKWKYYIYD